MCHSDDHHRLQGANSIPVLEETWIEGDPRLPPLNVEVEREGDAEVTVVDLEHVGDVQLHHYLVGLAAERDVHGGVVSGRKTLVYLRHSRVYDRFSS